MTQLISRRSFLQGTGIVAATAALTACGGNKNPTSGPANADNQDFSAVLAEFKKPAAALQDCTTRPTC